MVPSHAAAGYFHPKVSNPSSGVQARPCRKPSFGCGRLLLVEKQVHHPAATNMLARLPAMVQDVGVGAAGIFEGVAQDWHAVEGFVLVDRLGKVNDAGGEPCGGDDHGTEGIA